MRIIKEGRKPKTEWKVTCKECGCVFVFDSRDINYDQREGDEWVNCPTCGEGFRVNNRNNWEDEE
ncbi:MAG: hypothetical protein J6B82_05765 [Bacteroidaceae bacterium]|nr:hypothetical protein [Bacteroidaceae bacterium]